VSIEVVAQVEVQGEGVPRRWSTIYAPAELKDRIDALAAKTGKPRWKIVLEAIALYETSIRAPRSKEELPVVDKVIWYIQKVAMSIGALKENPSESNLAKTMKTIEQIKERLGVDTRILERAVRDYMATARREYQDQVARHADMDEVTMELNMALKSVLIEIMYRYILKEELATQAVPRASQA
jgi:hypothetical protein